MFHLAVHHFARVLQRGVFRPYHGQYLQGVPHGAERIAQLMGQHAQEFILSLIGLLDALNEPGILQGSPGTRCKFAGQRHITGIIGRAGGLAHEHQHTMGGIPHMQRKHQGTATLHVGERGSVRRGRGNIGATDGKMRHS